MAAPLMVWGTGMISVPDAAPAPNGCKQCPIVVAARSRAAAARAMGVSPAFLKTYGSVTGNPEQIRAAMSEPGVAFYLDRRGDGQWKRYTP